MTSFPSLAGLRAFEAAARRLSFTRAAEELGVTPTAVSHAVRALEAYCGVTLVRRRPRPIALTREGEALFPIVRDAFAAIGDAAAGLREGAASGRLKVTVTNAFAARWLLPRLPRWRDLHPGLRLDVVGTDAVLDLSAGEADVAIRYARHPPAGPGLESVVLMRDTFHVVASPALVGDRTLPLSPASLADLPLLDCAWPPTDVEAPTWRRWEEASRRRHPGVPNLAGRVALSFAEELHMIEAVIGGQGAAICSDVLVGGELTDGRLVRICDVSLSGYGFHVVFRTDSPRARAARKFLDWLRASSAPDDHAPASILRM